MKRLLLLTLAAMTALALAEDKPKDKGKASAKAKPQVGGGDYSKTGTLPPATGSLASRAATAYSQKDWAAARKAYREMLELDPENALVWGNLGAVEQQDNHADGAVACFEASVRFNPALVQSWSALGLLYSGRGDHYKAISAFSRAIHEDPLDPKPHNFLAIEAKNQGWNDAAMAELQRAIELDANYGLAHFNLATMYLDQKPPARALAKRHYDKALSLGVEKDDIMERKLKGE